MDKKRYVVTAREGIEVQYVEFPKGSTLYLSKEEVARYGLSSQIADPDVPGRVSASALLLGGIYAGDVLIVRRDGVETVLDPIDLADLALFLSPLIRGTGGIGGTAPPAVDPDASLLFLGLI